MREERPVQLLCRHLNAQHGGDTGRGLVELIRPREWRGLRKSAQNMLDHIQGCQFLGPQIDPIVVTL